MRTKHTNNEPFDEAECWKMLSTGYSYQGPAAVRYPRGKTGSRNSKNFDCLEIGKAKVINDVDSEIVIFFWKCIGLIIGYCG